MCKIITMYNHKGGVSKTTTTFNFAHFLALQKKKILVVDADPQCNITEIMLAALIERMDAEAEKTGQVNDLPGSSVLQILKPRIDGDTPTVDIDKIETINISENLDLIRGDVNLSSIEDSLAESHNQRFSTKIHDKRTYVAIGDFLTRFGKKNNYDYIFIDVGPSAGALTRSCFLVADAFFIPVAPDRFCYQAVSTLAEIIKRWVTEHDQIISDFSDLKLPIRPGKPRFLGLVFQFYKKHKGKPKPGYKLWMEKIPRRVFEILIPSISSASNTMCTNIKIENVIVSEIPDFQALAPISHAVGKPVFDLSQEDTGIYDGKPWSGGTWVDAQKRMQEINTKFNEIAQRLNWIK